jgi:hypothetical protein
MGPQTYKEMYARGQALPPGIHFFVKIGKFGVPYFYEFATDSNEISHISGKAYFLFE